MKLYVGLGNPGEKYRNTRHNAGREILQALCPIALSFSKKYQSLFGQLNFRGQEFLFLLPETFMNLSGDAVYRVVKEKKILAQNIIVFHDELDLAPGEVRFKLHGGHNGHNGLKDIIAKLGSEEFARIRIGIGRPKFKNEISEYVLQKADFSWPIERVKEVLRQNHWEDFSSTDES